MAYGFLNGSNYNEETMSIAQLVERTMTEFHVPTGVVRLGTSAFAYCPLTQIYLPEGIEEIGSSALAETTLTDITLPLSCGILKGACLGNNKQLTKIIFGKVRTIQGNAFKGDSICMIFDFSRCDSVPNLQSTNSFDGTASDSKILVPGWLYEAWINATNWSNFAERIVPVYDAPEVEVPDHVSEGLSYGYDDMYRKNGIWGRGSCTDTCVVIPAEIDGNVIGMVDGFRDDGLVEECWMWVPEITMGSDFLYGCPNLKKFYLDTSIEQSLSFADLKSLEYVKFGSHVSSIAAGVFQRCANVVFDFSDCTSIPALSSYGYGEEFGTNPTIMVPVELYGEWISNDATGWVVYQDHIVPVK